MFNDHLIEMRNMPIKQRVSGTAKFSIRYGHPKREKYTVFHNFKYEAAFQENVGGYVIIGQQERERGQP